MHHAPQVSLHTGRRLRKVAPPHSKQQPIILNAILSSLYDESSCIVQDSFNLTMRMLMIQEIKLDL